MLYFDRISVDQVWGQGRIMAIAVLSSVGEAQ